MALLCAAMMAAASLGVAAPAQAAFRFDRTDMSLSIGTNQRLTDVSAADLDGANGPDIVVSARGDNMVYVLLNQGGGTFAGPVGYSACAPSTGAAGQIVTGQLNVTQDQRLDVAVACGVLTVLHGNGAGALGAPVPTALASSGSLAVGELTGGGGPELLTGAPTADAAADLLCFVVQPFELADIRCGNPAPVEDPPLLASTVQGPLAGTQTPIAANFSDPLGRRYDEVVGVNPLNTREVSVYGREPVSNFTSWSSTMRATSADRAYFLDVGDVESDGDRDLLVGHLQGGVLDVFVWGGSGILPGAVPRTTQTIGSATTDGKLADFDGDGALDVVVAGLQGRLAVHRGRGDGTFAPGQDVAVPAAAGAILAVADLSGDRQPDIVLGTSQGSAGRSDQVSVLINGTPTAPPAGTPVLRPARGITGLKTRFRVSRRQKALRLAKATNPSAAATKQALTARRPGHGTRRVVIGSGRTTVATGMRRTVVLRLNRRGRRLLRDRRKMTARLVLVAHGPTGLRDTIKKRVRLTAKPSRR
jgi:hypothetical protein